MTSHYTIVHEYMKIWTYINTTINTVKTTLSIRKLLQAYFSNTMHADEIYFTQVTATV